MKERACKALASSFPDGQDLEQTGEFRIDHHEPQSVDLPAFADARIAGFRHEALQHGFERIDCIDIGTFEAKAVPDPIPVRLVVDVDLQIRRAFGARQYVVQIRGHDDGLVETPPASLLIRQER